MADGDLQPVVLYGSSGHARTFVLLRKSILDTGPPFRVAAYLDDFVGGKGADHAGVPIIDFETWRTTLRELPCIVTVGDPRARRKLVTRIKEAGGTFLTVYAVDGPICPDVTIGEGCTLGTSCIIGASSAIGLHCQVMGQVVIGHDCVVGDFVTICSGVKIGGCVTVEDDAFIGSGAVIVNGTVRSPLRIGRGAMVAAGAVVMKSVAPGARVFGNPARDLRSMAGRNERSE